MELDGIMGLMKGHLCLMTVPSDIRWTVVGPRRVLDKNIRSLQHVNRSRAYLHACSGLRAKLLNFEWIT
jgi:hypothetical protein